MNPEDGGHSFAGGCGAVDGSARQTKPPTATPKFTVFVTILLVPVMTAVTFPNRQQPLLPTVTVLFAVAPTARVILTGLKDIEPSGFEPDSDTVPEKPLMLVKVRSTVVDLPERRSTWDGVTFIVNVGITVTGTITEWVTPPPEPVTVTV